MPSVDKLNFAIRKMGLDVNLDEVKRAYEFAAAAHKGQKRMSGDDFIVHPLETAVNLCEMKVDQASIIAGLLHDVVEDTDIPLSELEKQFGHEVAFLVDSLSKLKKVRYYGSPNYIENLRKMFVAMAHDIRVILIKFADRLHNMQTLDYMPREEQQRIARETLEIYAPIANRLRLGRIKGRLQDWSFRYLYPEEFRFLNNLSMRTYYLRDTNLAQTKANIEKLLTGEKIHVVSLHDRVKFLYSTYKKMLEHDMDITQIYDLIALRIVVPSISDCYSALGIIHRKYKPLKGRIKDYIAQPKPNGYQSLHTTVFGENGDIVEIQLRTPEMHEEAEYGIAAHWHFKERGIREYWDKRLSWVKELAHLIKNMENTQQFESMKIDLFQNRIFVFTPRGDVIDLPENSTPVDFAYHIHTDVGNHCIKCKVNEKPAGLDIRLQNGDVVEIFTDKKRAAPNIDWLKFVQTSLAKSRIKEHHKKKMSDWEENLAKK